MRSAFLLSLFVAFLSRVYSDVVLTQAEQETAGTGATVRLVCKATGFSFDGFGMHWVRQVPGQGLEWLLYFYIPSIKYFAPGIQNRFTPSRDTSKSIFVVDIKNLKTEDTAVYYCARDQWGDPRANFDYWGGGTMLTVTAAAAASPALYPLLSCEQHSPADSITFSCLAMDYLPVGISVSWKKDKETISTGLKTYPAVFNKKGTYTRSSQLTVSESEVGNSAIYCVVRHGDSVKEVKMPDRVVRHPTVSITVNSLEEIRRSRKVIAICSITEFWPKALTVSWLRNGQALDSGFVTAPSFNDNGNFSATSRLTLSAGEWLQDSIYTCKVTHKGVTQSQNISTSQDFSDCGEEIITIQPPPLEQVLLEATVTLTCVIYHVPYGATVTWSQGKTLLKSETAFQPGETPESVISNLSISTQDWLSGDEFHCVVSHEEMPTPERASISKGKDPHAQEPSVSVFFPTTEEASAQRSVTITCLVRGFSPRQIFVKWTVDGKLVNSSNYRNTEVVAETGNRSFFVYSLFTVGVEQWASGASFSCVVGHETLPMKTIARTVNRSSGKPSFVNVSLVLMDTVNSCQ